MKSIRLAILACRVYYLYDKLLYSVIMYHFAYRVDLDVDIISS